MIPSSVSCSSDPCSVKYRQDYCGMSPILAAVEVVPWGRFLTDPGLGVGLSSRTERGISWIENSLLPVVPVYANAVISADEAKAKLIGYKVKYYSKQGWTESELTESSWMEVDAGLSVFVRPTSEGADLAYRTAYRVQVNTGAEPNPGWTAYVDAITGEVLASDPNSWPLF